MVPVAEAPLDSVALASRRHQYRGRFAAHGERLARNTANRERALAAHRPGFGP
jgi:hypothetical protein